MLLECAIATSLQVTSFCHQTRPSTPAVAAVCQMECGWPRTDRANQLSVALPHDQLTHAGHGQTKTHALVYTARFASTYVRMLRPRQHLAPFTRTNTRVRKRRRCGQRTRASSPWGL